MSRTPSHRLCGMTLAALVVLPALPVAAAPAAIELHLEHAIALEPLELATASPTPEPAPRQPATTISASELRAAAWQIDEQAEAGSAAAPAPEKHGFGRWLKKRWYVAVLVAVAAGVAIDSGGDNDRGGEED